MTLDDATIGDEEAPFSGREPAGRRRIGVSMRWIRRWRTRWRPILLAALMIATTGFAAGVFLFQYHPDRQTGDQAAHQVVSAASDGAVALLSYSPDSLNRDFTNAKSRLTGDFLAHYQQFTDQIVAPAAQRGHVTTTASVVRAALSELHPNSAVVLMFVRQKAVGKDKAEPAVMTSSVRVTLTKVNDAWLIEHFDVL